ncbi:alpha/beta fold hydrolase [Stakelama saccharophila]|uniref:Alpha/beta fold hydrolase n=1 Tax=Stakelama saccharophila TaxID=3075605 RepID=A0ABZ0B937_9SPHN|nr:alpha/beta fold hydrolase [Stakelama sp. W311]WNO53363.1 alpha/beta fold hydrolase [Stakelama sp. W311]
MLRNETAASPERRAAALKGLRAYQEAPRDPNARQAPIIARSGRASLRDYGGSGRPVVFVPSLINPPFILDLAPENSLLQWLRSHSDCRPMLVDWGTPEPADSHQDVTAHVESLLLPMLKTLQTPPVLAGYCLGGTIATAAAAVLPVAGLALIAAPWRFSGFGRGAIADIDALWRTAQPTCEALGLVPMEVLQSGFWRLDPARTVAKFERFGTLDPDSERARAFVALEDWANAGAPLTYAAGRQMFDDFFTADLPGRGRWMLGGRPVLPGLIGAPMVEFVSTTDRIVPAASAIGLPDQRRTAAGHVGMVVGGRAREALWQPLADWIRALPALT